MSEYVPDEVSGCTVHSISFSPETISECLIFFPYGNLTQLLLKPWPIEIVDLPSYTMAIFHSFLYVYQGALCLEKNPLCLGFLSLLFLRNSRPLSQDGLAKDPNDGTPVPICIPGAMFDVWAVHEMCGTYRGWSKVIDGMHTIRVVHSPTRTCLVHM